MRTPLWERSSGALVALLNSAAPLNLADLYTVTLSNGSVLRWSGSDVGITGNGSTWVLGPGLKRGRVKFTIGTAVDDLQVTITDNIGTLINGVSLSAFICAGGLVGARLQLDRAFWGAADTAPVGALMWYEGRIAEVSGDRYGHQLTVRDDRELLSVQIPREVYQAGCLNAVFDSACLLNRASYTVSGAASSATDAALVTFSHGLVQAAGYFDLGTITMTSGANAGISRTVKTQTTGALTVLNPWPLPVASGDAFTVVPGCDKTQATCSSKFSNVVHFRGQPYIPTPETIL